MTTKILNGAKMAMLEAAGLMIGSGRLILMVWMPVMFVPFVEGTKIWVIS